MPIVRIARENLQQLLWPGQEHRVTIKGARFDAKERSVVLVVEGKGLPESNEVRPIVSREAKTTFFPVKE